MSINNFKETLTQLLKQDTRLVDEQGELLINIIHELTNALDPQLIELLLGEAQTREKFFLRIKDVYVFKQSDFKFFLDENKIDNSYTQYENKIGLSFSSRLLRETTDVVLNFPYKDCVLEGGQSTEEGTDICFEYDVQAGDYAEKKAKRKEIFFNQVLARDEIDRLFEPKAFTNIKCFDKENPSGRTLKNTPFGGLGANNLIIKGNNLLALHSLKHEFRGKVKLIYIDPPYNTGSDSFAYNDNFNHSTWLTFMKNRLEVAREFLREDGFIFVHCDDSELAYLRVLLDEVFSRVNFRNLLLTRRFDKNLNNQFIENGLKTLNVGSDYVSVYSKSSIANLIPVYREASEKRSNSGYWKGFWNSPDRPTMRYPILDVDIDEGQWKWEKVKAMEAVENYEEYLRNFKDKLTLEEYWENTGKVKKFIKKNSTSKGKNKGIEHWIPPSDGILRNSNWNDILTSGTLTDFDFKNPKSEKLMVELIKLACEEEDIILDFHAGSGTTAHAVLQLNKEDGGNRQFILVEQMDYAESITAARVQKVIEKEGIENSFIYLELAKNNQNAIENIQKANDLAELMTFFEEMYEKYFLSYNVRIKEFRDKISQEGAFKNLPLERQKQIFAKMLDLNQLYINVSDMEDTRFGLSQESIALTKDFYQLV